MAGSHNDDSRQNYTTSIAELADLLLSDSKFSRGKLLYRIALEWSNIVGKELAAHTRPVALSNKGVLTVAGSDSVWLNELAMRKESILRAVSAMAGKKRKIKDVRFIWKQDELEKLPYTPNSSGVVTNKRVVFRAPTDEETEFVNRCVGGIEDKELRKLLAEIIIRDICRVEIDASQDD